MYKQYKKTRKISKIKKSIVSALFLSGMLLLLTGCSQPRASQIHTIALRKLRHFIETKNGKGIKSDVSGIL